MRRISIREPIWKTPRSIGIAEYKITDNLEIDIEYRENNGMKLYPQVFCISKNECFKYPVQTIKNGLRLRIIPIEDLRVKNE